MNAIRELLRRIKTTGHPRASAVKTHWMGHEHTFHAYDLRGDTFILEDGVAKFLGDRPSVLIVEKQVLSKKAHGHVLTMTTGNHAVGAMPLLDGRFWGLSTLKPDQRSATMEKGVLCANVVNGTIETSQREVPCETLYQADAWLQNEVGLSMTDIVMGDRNEQALLRYRRLGQEWRVKPLAWTENEMRIALKNAKRHLSSRLTYYHSARGVHFVAFPEFQRFVSWAESDLAEFLIALREMAGVDAESGTSFLRDSKFRGHHEIELFGPRRGLSLEHLVPALENLLKDIDEKNLSATEIVSRAKEIEKLYESLLSQPELTQEDSTVFIDTLYMYITGEIYYVMGEGSTPAFDDRRTALPGATFEHGKPIYHPGVDKRTEVLMRNLLDVLSQGEKVEFANIYELRNDENTTVGKGSTREIVYKTNFRPLVSSVVEKCVARAARGYDDYLLARIGALRALGIGLSGYYKLLRTDDEEQANHVSHYIRMRCEGEPLNSIPASYYREDGQNSECVDVVQAMAMKMGDAAAQNCAILKYEPLSKSSLFGVGKEIYAFSYDLERQRMMPSNVTTCSVRGSFGWPTLERDDINLQAMRSFYIQSYVQALKAYAEKHSAVSLGALAKSFMEGFEFRTRALNWRLTRQHDQFAGYHPKVLKSFNFDKKWKFLLWALGEQEKNLPAFREEFYRKVGVEA